MLFGPNILFGNTTHMKHLKGFVVLVLFCWAVQLSALAQGSMQFNIDFGNPLTTPRAPRGSAALSGDYFMVRLFVGYGPATSVLITERQGDNSFAPVLVCTNLVTQYVPPLPGQPGLGHDYYFYDQAWEVTDLQAQNLLAGRWYAEVVYYDPATYRAQIAPVPEPSGARLLLSGLVLLAVYRRRGWHFAELQGAGDAELRPLFIRESVARHA
jgi:hypothetical protein